ncbi:redoxin domain-containing protein [Polluticaenibacter yanchengensis]|uniref:TlpA disulfide reductase family protein n=1 Tax=Polluticaenibacter yanchengensis TaxID=3014562 RepID=A0ABT4UNW1_9BACT|nr:TlpA disulfide reductase family protein [Chitinophagaceae bacterium LY-5]
MKKISLIVVAGLLVLSAAAQKEKASKGQIFYDITQKGTDAQKDSLKQVLIDNAKLDTKEEDLQLSYNFLNTLKANDEAKVVEKKIVKLYPKGKFVRQQEISKFHEIETLKDKEKAFNTILKKFPIEKFPGDEIVYDYAVSSLARQFANEGNKEKALHYLSLMKEEFWKAQGDIPVATEFLKQGDTAAALPLIKASITSALKFIKGDVQDNKAKFAGVGYPGYVGQYANILIAQGKYEEALQQIEEAKKIVPERSEDFLPSYAKALQNVNRHLEAFNAYSTLYRKGQFHYYEPIADLYVKLNKSNTGLEGYVDDMKATLNENIKRHLESIITDKETPAFKLRNLKGEIVNSKDLLGKVVVLDFWATWCQPCIRSFPGMQLAVKKYENDHDVVFLFLDTWERGTDYEQKVNDFITKNKYTFNVLFDDAKTDDNIAPKFNISGIPAKFVIDKKGKTRFFLTGSSPYPDYILLELTQMIERAKKG